MNTHSIELQAYRIMAETGLSARELAEMDMTEYARLTGRPTPAQAALAALDAQHQQEAAVTSPFAGQDAQDVSGQQAAPEPPGIDLASMDMATYAQMRGQLGVGGREYGVGIMNSNAGTDSWVAAARAKSGRTGMNESNVQGAARPDAGKYLDNGGRQVTGRTSFYR